MRRSLSWLSLLTCLLAVPAYAQQVQYLFFKYEGNHTISQYRINRVTDARADKGNLGRLRTPQGHVDLTIRPNLETALDLFLKTAVKQPGTGSLIDIQVTKLAITGSKDERRQQVNMETGIAFYKDGAMLTEYSGTAGFQASAADNELVGQKLAATILEAVKRFDSWWQKEKNETRVDNSTRFEVVLEKNPQDERLLGYEYANKLTWPDFRGAVPAGASEMALTASGLKLRFDNKTTEGNSIIRIVVTPFFNPEQSWVRTGADNNVLIHERVHYQVTLVETCKLVQALRQQQFNAKNLQPIAQKLYETTMNAIRTRQIAYDEETNHGIEREPQNRWTRMLATEMADCGCY